MIVAFTLKYHRVADRMTIGFTLPSGARRICWVTRRQWLMLILRLSAPADLPTQIKGQTKDISDSEVHKNLSSLELAENTNTSGASVESRDRDRDASIPEVRSDHSMIVKKIGVVKTQTGFRISFGVSDIQDDRSVEISERINLNITPQERKTLLDALSAKARQAGWDLDAGLKRLRTNQRRQKARTKSTMH